MSSSHPSQTDLAARVLAGETRAVARAMRLVDDRAPEAETLLKALWPHTGKAWVIGVTGTQGAGKSTLCDRLIETYRRTGVRVGVVAVDPSSPYSGGAIFGDRIRMARHATDDGVFIRSVATRGHLGGLSRSTRDIVRILDAAGYGAVLVETVGVGQDELEITRAAHSTLIVMAPGLGDGVQAIKAGLLEGADVFAVNKSDRDGADAVVRDLEMMIALGKESGRALSNLRGQAMEQASDEAFAAALSGAWPTDRVPAEKWTPPIVQCVATRGEGVDEVARALSMHRAWLEQTAEGKNRTQERRREEVRQTLREALIEAATEDVAGRLEELAAAVEGGSLDLYAATDRLVAAFRTRS